MKKKSILRYAIVGAFAFAMISCQTDSTDDVQAEVEKVTFNESEPISGSYIIVYNNVAGKMPALTKTTSEAAYRSQMSNLKASFVSEFKSIDLKAEDIKATYGHALKGFTANLSDDQVAALKKDPRVQSIEQDLTISISPFKGKPGGGGGTPDPQSIPYGTTRVGGGTATSSNTAWIIDSGIDLDHPDLNVDVSRSASFVRGDADDQNGHGTHVAGTVGAINNDIGSVGVSPGNLVVAVRVLDRRGSGSISGVVAGVDYVAANASNGDVANMSLGGGASTTLDNAVIAAAQSGVVFALAAGNSGADANNSSPARANHANIYTISAMDVNDNWASFSNWGNPPIENCAPGVAVFSTWKDGGYNTISGTSMASPHAAGVLLFGNPSSDGTVNGDPDGNPDPIIHN